MKIGKLPWQVWATGLTLLSSGVVLVALELLGSQEFSECQPNISTTAPEPNRLYCAQLSAGKETVEGLSAAITLARSIPVDHPLHLESERLIERWSLKLLELGEAVFQEGKLEDAIAAARRIPALSPAYDIASERISRWQSIWEKAEGVYKDAEAELEQDNWRPAFDIARKLITAGNEYWATTRYRELVEQIQTTKESKDKQAKNSGDRTRRKPEPFRVTTGKDLLAHWQKEQEQEAIVQLQRARQLANPGDAKSLQAATDAAEQVLYGTPQYHEAQRLAEGWRRQVEAIEDRPYLDRAVKLASQGDPASLQAAIAEASNVGFGRALYREAQDKIGQWTARIQELHLQSFPEQVPARSRPVNQDNYQIPQPISTTEP
jgi:soluble cytochrome b562